MNIISLRIYNFTKMLQIIAILFVITIIKYYICVTELNLLYDGS